jgi:glycosyltransferase involved in cell wall biosynthesis
MEKVFLRPVARKSTVLIVSQVYIPDPASVGQHLHDLARELVSQNKRVIVFTPKGGYDDPSRKYRWREIVDGVKVYRLPLCTFGKKSIMWRLLGGLSLSMQSMFLGLFVSNLTHVLVSTAPPMSVISAQFIRLFRKVKVVFWVMDLNPDQMIALGKLRQGSIFVKIGDGINRWVLRTADCVIALDTFMAKRLQDKVKDKTGLLQNLRIIPPWPYENQLISINHEINNFRKNNSLDGKFVVMYSGNIGSVHPIDTLLEAIVRLKEINEIIFLFIGGESARMKLDDFARAHGLSNLRTLPYVPLAETQYSLSAADLHIVIMGDSMVGIVHPCKVYGIMSVGRPFLAFGPKVSHIGEILDEAPIGWLVEHGDIDGAVRVLKKAWLLSRDEWKSMSNMGQELVKQKYSRKVLCHRFCQFFEE